MKDKKYFFDLDFIRFLSCIAIFLYHLNILKGGYLAVCTFFVMTSYLSCISAFKKDKFNILKHYKNRLIHIYIPFIIVVFTSICIISFIDSINWLNLKPETTSVIFGYNNFWQLNVNLDYFARHVSSPFMHFWFMGILLEFELIFPFIFIIFKKLGDKTKKLVPIILLSILCIISTCYFYYCSTHFSKMYTYYNTFSRAFSLLFGLLLGFIHSYYKGITIDKKVIRRVIFYLYLVILIVLTIFIDSSNEYFALCMIGTTIISCRLIDYGTLITKEFNIFKKIISYISKFSYEIYLVQYPVIFLFQLIKMDLLYKNLLIILITVLISFILHFALDLKKNKKVIRIILLIPLVLSSIFGLYKYIITKDYTKDLKELEESMALQEEEMKKKQEEYEKKIAEESANWNSVLDDLDAGEEALKEKVSKLPIVGVGDSVMLGATSKLYKVFPNGYFDAKVSRTDYEANDILVALKNKGHLGDVVVIGLGTNGQCGSRCRSVILKTVGNRKLFWINVSNENEVHVNKGLKEFADANPNVYLIDWYTASLGHKEYFVADGIHLTGKGITAYTSLIYDEIYSLYLNEYNEKKEQIIKEHEEEMKTKISFYGNELLINSYSNLKEIFPNANFNTKSNYKYQDLYNDLKTKKESNTLDYKLVFVFDSSTKISSSEYENIIDLCSDHEIYIVLMDKMSINKEVNVIEFYKEIDKHNNYLSFDKKHLSSEGNTALSTILDKTINKENRGD